MRIFLALLTAILIHCLVLPGLVQAEEKPGANATFHSPAFQQWTKDVAAMPAEKQVEAVAKKLQELNPGFDGKVEPEIENGVVTKFFFVSQNVTDISPVRALPGLKFLACHGGYLKKSTLSDLSPLKGMSLTRLVCHETRVSDLTPLKGMPLTRLDCYNTDVSDLSPLQGMPLTLLQCGKTQVSDLSPLRGMKLTDLYCIGTRVSDLSPLRHMELKTLLCSETQISELFPLEECKNLKTLKIANTKVSPAGVAALQKALPDCKIE